MYRNIWKFYFCCGCIFEICLCFWNNVDVQKSNKNMLTTCCGKGRLGKIQMFQMVHSWFSSYSINFGMWLLLPILEAPTRRCASPTLSSNTSIRTTSCRNFTMLRSNIKKATVTQMGKEFLDHEPWCFAFGLILACHRPDSSTVHLWKNYNIIYFNPLCSRPLKYQNGGHELEANIGYPKKLWQFYPCPFSILRFPGKQTMHFEKNMFPAGMLGFLDLDPSAPSWSPAPRCERSWRWSPWTEFRRNRPTPVGTRWFPVVKFLPFVTLV